MTGVECDTDVKAADAEAAHVEATASSAQRQALLATLDNQRRHVLSDLEGLDEEALRRPVLPSAWGCLGLVAHLTNDVERFWFGCVVAGDQDTIAKTMSGGNAWEVAANRSGDDVLTTYREEITRSNIVIASSSLDAAPAWWPDDLFGSWRLETVGEIVLHAIVETATHAGQLDAVRELIDGRQWVVLT